MARGKVRKLGRLERLEAQRERVQSQVMGPAGERHTEQLVRVQAQVMGGSPHPVQSHKPVHPTHPPYPPNKQRPRFV